MLTATAGRGGSLALKAFMKEAAVTSSSSVTSTVNAAGPLESAKGTVRTISSTSTDLPQKNSYEVISNERFWDDSRRRSLSFTSSSCSRKPLLQRQLSTTIHNHPKQAAAPGVKGGGAFSSHIERLKRPREPVNLAYISYERKDSLGKTPLVVQHGLFGCKENWKKVSKEINLISKRSVFAVDGRNHGESPHTIDMTLPLMATDVQHFVSQIGLEKISFMGHSSGGRIGMMMALMYPKSIDKLVVVEASPLPVKGSMNSPVLHATAVLKNMEQELRECHGYNRGLKAEKAIENIVKDTRHRAVVLSNLVTSNGSSRDSFGRPREVTNNGVKPDPNSLWRVNLDAVLSNPALTDFPDFGSEGPTPTFAGKTLFIQGKESSNIRQCDEARIQRLFPNAQFIYVDETGPWLHLEKQEEFLKHVLKFLEKKD